MASFVRKLWALTLCASAVVVSIPSPIDVGSDLTHLIQNDLDWTTTPNHNGTILLDEPQTYDTAVRACSRLNEGLLPPAGQYFQSDIKLLLGYVAHQIQDDSIERRYWVSGRTSLRTCPAITASGQLLQLPCETRLLALCSQSAPYRSNAQTDLSPAYHVNVRSKGIVFTGTRDKLSFRFLGIPFADPFARFTYSKVYSGAGPISALKYGSACAQSGGSTISGSEDCLFLNIYTPYLPRDGERTKRLRPVMFFIHGGGLTNGDARGDIYDGGNTASRGDVVFVSIQYRLRTLGFLALEDGVTNGNFGIADQITALQWVQKHISAFGGDPNRVTILGHSAGAGSVRALLAAKPAFGLFHAGIAQSNLGGFGYATAYSQYLSIKEQVQAYAQPLIDAAGCGTVREVLRCLQNTPLDKLLTNDAPRYIVVDGKYITTSELKLDGTGPTAKAHVIFGWTRDDGSDFVGSWPGPNTTALERLVGAGLAKEVAQRAIDSGIFPLPNDGPSAAWNLFNQTTRIGTDGQFLCIDQATLISAAKNKVFPSVYGYQFDRTYAGWEPIPNTCNPPASRDYPHGDPSLPYFRCHDGELRYTLGNLGQASLPFRDGNDLIMTQLSLDVWTSFARTFDPNPSAAFLNARGYTNTSRVLEKYGRWNPVNPKDARPLKRFDLPFSHTPWVEEKQCDVLGFPLTMYG